MSSSKRLNLPFLEQSQAQKEVVVNEALSSLDFLVQPVVLAMQTSPPSTVAEGDAYIINGVGTGSWSGKNNNVAVRVNGTWKYMAPFMGMSFFSVADNASYAYTNGQWQRADGIEDLKSDISVLDTRITALEAGSGGGGISGNTTLINYTTFNNSTALSTTSFAIKGTTFMATNNIKLYGITYDIKAANIGEKYKFMILKLNGNTGLVNKVLFETSEFTLTTTARQSIFAKISTPLYLASGNYYAFAIAITSGTGTATCRCYFDNDYGSPTLPGLIQVAWFRDNTATSIIDGQTIKDYVTSSQSYIGCGIYTDLSVFFAESEVV